MAQETAKKLLKRREKAVGETAQWMSILKSAYKMAAPNRNIWEMTEKGANLNDETYDTTLVSATKRFVHNTVNALMPPNKQFLKLVAGIEIPEDDIEEVNKALQKVTDIFFFYLNKSNFNLVIYESLLDMAISTGIMQINEGDDDNPLIFTAVPTDRISFETDARGEFIAFFRDWHKMKLEQCYALWGDDFKLPDAYSGREKDDVELVIYEISYWDYSDKNYKYCLIDKQTSEILFERESDSWEWVAFRMNKLSGEDRGRGIVLDALPSALTINKAVYDELAAAAMQSNPSYMVYSDSVINPYNLKIQPNALIPVQRDGSGTWPIAPLPAAGNPQFSALVINDFRHQINEIMMAQPLIPIYNAPDKTATEVTIEQNNIRENASAAFNRLQRELFDPLVNRVLYILRKKGLIPNIKIDGKEVALSYITPLAQSKDQTRLQNFLSFYQTMQSIYGQEIATALIDVAKLPMWVGEKLDSELSLIKSESEIQSIIQNGLKEMQNQEQQGVQQP